MDEGKQAEQKKGATATTKKKSEPKMREVRKRAVGIMCPKVGKIARKLAEMAEQGNCQAAKLVFEFLGIFPPPQAEEEGDDTLARYLLRQLGIPDHPTEEEITKVLKGEEQTPVPRIILIEWILPQGGRGKPTGMDMTWVTERIALGGAIWSDSNMQEVARSGVTHIIDMQIEFDDTELARPYGIEVLWNGTDDDFQPKPPELFEKGVGFGLAALEENGGKLYIHCAAGVHRAAMMTLALLGAMGWEMDEAMETIQGRRPVVDFADVYVRSVENFLRRQELSRGAADTSGSGNGEKRPPVESRNKI